MKYIKRVILSTLLPLGAFTAAAVAGSLPQTDSPTVTSLQDDEDNEEPVFDPKLVEASKALGDYDFSRAASQLALFNKTRKKAEEHNINEADDIERRLKIARNALAHVQDVVVIDSIAVPAADFFASYRIPASGGKILQADDIPIESVRDEASMAFSNESGDFLMWARPDSVGVLRIVESTRLTDGTWQEPVYTPEKLNMEGDTDFPFLSSDGTMLYYASDGEGSMGGYDIFAATRDPQTGEYLDPLNLGMPFNSPADDYMMALDEENGVGWWATDRNHIPDMVTVYLYVLSDARENLDPEAEDIVERARISSYRATWLPDEEEDGEESNKLSAEEYEALAQKIREIDPNASTKEDFRLPMPGRQFYTLFTDFQSDKARGLMLTYLERLEEHNEAEATLRDLRKQYAGSRDRQLASRIKQLEKNVETARDRLKKLRSDIYKEELRRR